MTASDHSHAAGDNPSAGVPTAVRIINHLQREGASSLEALRAGMAVPEPALREALDALQDRDAIEVRPRFHSVRVTLTEEGPA